MPDAPALRADHLDGRPLGDLEAEYALLRELGRGANGAVYLARRRTDGCAVAIKLVPAQGAGDGGRGALAGTAREARIVSRLRHENIVRHLGICATREGGLALVMEYVAGRTLRQLLDGGAPLPYDTVEAVLRDVARALAHAHARGVVHRDVKPENVFFDAEQGRALLADFDIATTAHAGADAPPDDGAVTGTPRYMPPEQIDGGAADARSDLYSLGVMGWEMLTGMRPWADGTLAEVLYQQKYEELPAVRTLRPDVPERLALAVEAAMQKQLDFRLSSAEEFLEQLSRDVPTGRTAQLRAFVRRAALPVARSTRAAAAQMVDSAARTVAFRRGALEELVLRLQAQAEAIGTQGRARLGLRRHLAAGMGVGCVAALCLAATVASGRMELGQPGALRVTDALASHEPSASPLAAAHPSVASLATALRPDDRRAMEASAGDPGAADAAGRLTRSAHALYARARGGARPSHDSRMVRARHLLDSAAAAAPLDPDVYLLRARVALALGDLRLAWADAETAWRLGRSWQGEAITVLVDVAARDTATARARAAHMLAAARARQLALAPEESAALAIALAAVGDRAAALDAAEHARPDTATYRALLAEPAFASLRGGRRAGPATARLR